MMKQGIDAVIRIHVITPSGEALTRWSFVHTAPQCSVKDFTIELERQMKLTRARIRADLEQETRTEKTK